MCSGVTIAQSPEVSVNGSLADADGIIATSHRLRLRRVLTKQSSKGEVRGKGVMVTPDWAGCVSTEAPRAGISATFDAPQPNYIRKVKLH